MNAEVVIASPAKKQLSRVPVHVAVKLGAWIRLVELCGLRDARRVPGFHDEPLRGKRKGQRSIRLSRKYRAIYTLSEQGNVELVTVEEVTPHDY